MQILKKKQSERSDASTSENELATQVSGEHDSMATPDGNEDSMATPDGATDPNTTTLDSPSEEVRLILKASGEVNSANRSWDECSFQGAPSNALKRSAEEDSVNDDFGGYTQDEVFSAFDDDVVLELPHPLPKNLSDRMKILPTLCLNQAESAHRLCANAKLLNLKTLIDEHQESRKKLKTALQEYNDAIFRLPANCDVKPRNKKEDISNGATFIATKHLRFNNIFDAL